MITARIKNITKGTSNKGAAFYKVLLDNGDMLFAWDWNCIRDVKVGEMAEFDTSTKAGYIYINSSRPVIAEEAKEQEIESEDTPVDTPRDTPKEIEPRKVTKFTGTIQLPDAKDRSIARESCLKSAIAYVSSCKPDGVDLTEDEIISVAQRFETFVYEGK